MTIIGNNMGVISDPQSLTCLGPLFWRREWVSSIASSFLAGEVLIDIDINGACNMGRLVNLVTRFCIGEIKAAVANQDITSLIH